VCLSDCIFPTPLYIATCSLSGRTVFSTLSHKRHEDLKKKVEHGSLLFISLQTLSETFLILRVIPRDIIVNVHRYPLFLLESNETFSTGI
jgi:hypothetical protein